MKHCPDDITSILTILTAAATKNDFALAGVLMKPPTDDDRGAIFCIGNVTELKDGSKFAALLRAYADFIDDGAIRGTIHREIVPPIQ